MRINTRALALVATVAVSASAWAGPQPAASQVTGYNLDLPRTEIVKLLKQLEQQGWIGPDQISIDSLRHEGDKPAYEAAISVIAQRIQTAVFELSELKRQVIRYSVIVNQANLSREKVALITKTSSGISKDHYDRAIWTLASAYSSENDVLAKCVSEVCVIEITDAFEELTRFAQNVNQGLDFRKLNGEARLFWTFDRPILRASFSKAFKAMVPDNQDHNAFKVVAAGIFTPISVAGVTTIDILKAAGSAIFNPRYENIKLSVDALDVDFGKVYEVHRGQFSAHYNATANGSRLAQWLEKKPAGSAPVVIKPVYAHATFDAPRPELTEDFWLSRVSGVEEAKQKQACARIGVKSAEKHYRDLDSLRAAVDKTTELAAEVAMFEGEILAAQKSDLKSYADQYAVLARSSKNAGELAQLDEKMKGYLFASLEGQLKNAASRFSKQTCPADFNYRYNAAVAHEPPKQWLEHGKSDGRGDCSGYVRYRGTVYHWGTGVRRAFLSIDKGQAMYWACSRELFLGHRASLCASVNLVTGERAGVTFGEALADAEVRDNQGLFWFSMPPEQFVRMEVPACFSEPAPKPVEAAKTPTRGQLPPAEMKGGRRGD